MWPRVLAAVAKNSQEHSVFSAAKSLFEGESEASNSLDLLASFSRQDLMQALECLQRTLPKIQLKETQDLTNLQLCQRLVLTANALSKAELTCSICASLYANDFDADDLIRCSECSLPSHQSCTSSLFLPRGFYWKCQDCDQIEHGMSAIFQNLRQAFNRTEDPMVKCEPLIEDNEDNHDDTDLKPDLESDEDFNGEDEDFVCFPQKGYLCDLCQFDTFDKSTFQAHVQEEEELFKVVQASVSSMDNNCIKCNDHFESEATLFEHITKFHSRPTDFPDFGDIEWKYLMSHGKRSCNYCGDQFQTSSEWIAHLRVNMGDYQEPDETKSEDQLDCCECQQTFKSHDALQIHISTFHRRKKRFLCAFCSFNGHSAKDLNSHIHIQHEGNFSRCTECDFEAWAHSVLRRHINVKHKKLKTYECKSCEFSAKSKASLAAHMNSEHNEYQTSSQTNSSSSEFRCCFCQFTSTSKKSFQEHFDLEHDGNRTQCLECDFKAPVVSHLRRHIDSIHRGLKKFPCDSCDHRATTKQGLDRHVRVKHLDLKDLECPHCDYKTSAPDALRSHAKKYHEDINEDIGEKPIKAEPKKRIYFGNRQPIPMVCRLCGESAPTTNKLAAHFADCHPFEKPFWCHQCNIGYETYYGIQNHNRKDHSEERHLCPICGYSTHGPQYLKRHYRRKHPHMLEALNAQQRTDNQQENKITADEKMKVAMELKGLSDEEISERVKALIELSEDGVWTCAKCKRRFEGKPKRALYSHIRERHFHMRHFKCKECNFLSYNRAEIQEHKEKHKADKPIHQCDLCGFICDNSTGLIRHKRGRFCQNGHLQRRKRDREKMARRMALAFSASEPTDNVEQPINRATNESPDLQRFPYGPHILY